MPHFYTAALAQPSTSAHEASDQLIREAAALVSDLRKSGRWQALFTTEQINGWLADDLLKNHPTLLPPTVSEPRVAIEDNQLMLGFRWQQPRWNVVVSLAADVYLREPNVVAVRIRKVRAGGLPLPLKNLLNDLIAAGRGLDLQIDEQQIEGDPLLLITPPQDGELRRPVGSAGIAGAARRPTLRGRPQPAGRSIAAPRGRPPRSPRRTGERKSNRSSRTPTALGHRLAVVVERCH